MVRPILSDTYKTIPKTVKVQPTSSMLRSTVPT